MIVSRNGGPIMADHPLPDNESSRDKLLTRPDEQPLPTPLDPASPEARGAPADPKPGPGKGQGDRQVTERDPNDPGETV
jgi:hypothetical protein